MVHPVAASYPCRAVRIPAAGPCHQVADLVACPYLAVAVRHMVDVGLLHLWVEEVENFQVRPVGAYLFVVAVVPVMAHLPGDYHPSYVKRFV